MALDYSLNNTGPEVQERLDQVPVTQAQLSDEIANREAADAAETQAREAADAALQDSIGAEATRAEGAEQSLGGRISAVEGKIPQGATPQNPLADKEWVNGSITNATADFITASVNDLVNYYLKSETYTKAEVQQIIDSIKQFNYQSVPELPTASAATIGIIYLVPSADTQAGNVKDEYITVYLTNEMGVAYYSWEQIGSTAIDLADYYTKSQTDAAITADLNTALASYSTTSQMNTAIETTIANLDLPDTYETKGAAAAVVGDAGADYNTLAKIQGKLEPIEGEVGDKVYEAGSGKGLGRKNLPLNSIGNKNLLSQSMINQANTVYVIQNDYEIGSDGSVNLNEDPISVTISGVNYYCKEVSLNAGETILLTTTGSAKIIINDGGSWVLYQYNYYTAQSNTTIRLGAVPTSQVSTINYIKTGGSVTIPANCTLKFEGGSISGGTIQGNNTRIDAGKEAIFNGVSFSGTWLIPEIQSSWLADVTGVNNIQKLFALCNNSINNKVYIDAGNYQCQAIEWVAGIAGRALLMSNMQDVDVVLNGTLILAANGLPDYKVLEINNCKNITVIGSGVLKGDRIDHDYSTHQGDDYATHEWGRGLHILSSQNITIDGITSYDMTGDGFNFGDPVDTVECKNIVLSNIDAHDCRRQGITIAGVINATVDNFTISGIGVTKNSIAGAWPKAAIDLEPNDVNDVSNIVISNGFITDCRQGIHLLQMKDANQKFENITLSEIKFKDCEFDGQGIAMFNCNNVTLTNIVYDTCSYLNAAERFLMHIRSSNNVKMTGVKTVGGTNMCGILNRGSNISIEQSEFIMTDSTNYFILSVDDDASTTLNSVTITATNFLPRQVANVKFKDCVLNVQTFDDTYTNCQFDGCIITAPSFGTHKAQSNLSIRNSKIDMPIFWLEGSNVSLINNIIISQIQVYNCDNAIIDGNEISKPVTLDSNYNVQFHGESYGTFTHNVVNVTKYFVYSDFSGCINIRNNIFNIDEEATDVIIYNHPSDTGDKSTFEDNVINGEYGWLISGRPIGKLRAIGASYGTSANRPTIPIWCEGQEYFDTTLGKMIYWTGDTRIGDSGWVDGDGNYPYSSNITRVGGITDRPALVDIYVGFIFTVTTGFTVNTTNYPAGLYSYVGTLLNNWLAPDGTIIADADLPTRA